MKELEGLGARIDSAIKNSPYKAREVAEHIGITPQAVSKAIRSDHMGKDNLRKMAEFIGVDQDWLINGKNVAIDGFDPDKMTECVMAFKKVIKETGMDNISETEITRLALTLYKANF